MAFTKGSASGTLRWARGREGCFDSPPPFLWTPSTPQRIKGCSPLIIPKQKSKRKNASRFAQTGCGPLRLLRALGDTRILQAAAPTAPPCIRHWRRSSPLQTRGCSPLIIPRQRSKRKNASRFAQRIFFRFSDLQAPQSLRDSSPQGATNANIKIIFPLIMARAHAVAISNSVTPAQTTRHILWRLHLPLQNPPPHGNRSPVRRGSSWPGPSGRRPAPAARRRRAR